MTKSLRWQRHSVLSEDPTRDAEVWESMRGSLSCEVWVGRGHEEPSRRHTPDTEVQQDLGLRNTGPWAGDVSDLQKSPRVD